MYNLLSLTKNVSICLIYSGDKVKVLEAEMNLLKEEVGQLEEDTDLKKAEIERLSKDCTEERQMNAKLETELITIKGFNLEDLQVLGHRYRYRQQTDMQIG